MTMKTVTWSTSQSRIHMVETWKVKISCLALLVGGDHNQVRSSSVSSAQWKIRARLLHGLGSGIVKDKC